MAIMPSDVTSMLFNDLGSLVHGYSPSGPWLDETLSTRQNAARYLYAKALSKYCPGFLPSREASQEAYRKWHASNAACAEWSPNPVNYMDDYLLERIRKIFNDHMVSFLQGLEDPVTSGFDNGCVGSGGTIASGGTSLYEKMFESPISYGGEDGEALSIAYGRWASSSPSWRDAVMANLHRNGLKKCNSSEASAVAKTVTAARLVFKQPTVNCFFQLGCQTLLRAYLRRRFGIDFENQQLVNRQLARIGSIFRGLCTIDLSDASDRIPMRFIEWCCEPWVVAWFKLSRMTHTTIERRTYEMHMLSEQGNGWTFPIQTLLFASVVQTAYGAHGEPLPRSGLHREKPCELSWSVFGDDIIVPNRMFDTVIRLLRLIGGVPNGTKSFKTEFFRESCGEDYLRGVNIRPCFIKDLTTVEARFVAYNQLRRWQRVHSISLRGTLRMLRRSVPQQWVPEWEGDDAGLHGAIGEIPDSCFHKSGIKRTKNGWQYNASRSSCVRFTVEATEEGGCITVPKKDPRDPSPDAEKVRPEVAYDPNGFLCFILYGAVRDSGFDWRPKVVNYSTRREFTWHWGFRPHKIAN